MSTRVLLVEDEPLLLSLYALTLNRSGFEVLTAPDLPTAEQRVLSVHPHVILLDLLIPAAPAGQPALENFHEPTGFRILRLVKSTPQLSHIKVIVLSNLDADEHVQSAKRLGADDYIVKSDIDPHQIGGRVTDVLHRPNGSAPKAK